MNHRVVNSELPLRALIGSSSSERRASPNGTVASGGLAASRASDVASVYHEEAHLERVSRRRVAVLSRAGTLLGTVGVALLPKCPACWSVYAALSGWLGLSVALEPAALRPLTLACLSLTLLVLLRGARQSGRYRPLLGATLAAVGVYLGKFWVESAWLVYISLAVLVVAALAGRRAERCSKLAQHA